MANAHIIEGRFKTEELTHI